MLSDKSDLHAEAKKIGPALIFERLWKELGIDGILRRLLAGRKFGFDVERAIFLTVLHRLFTSGSDRSCDRWHRDYVIKGVDGAVPPSSLPCDGLSRGRDRGPEGSTPSRRAAPRTSSKKSCSIGARISSAPSTSSSSTRPPSTSREREETIGELGHSKDHRPDLNQMIVGVVLDSDGNPVCSEMWPGNTADVTTLVPVMKRIRSRFPIGAVSASLPTGG